MGVSSGRVLKTYGGQHHGCGYILYDPDFVQQNLLREVYDRTFLGTLKRRGHNDP